MNLRHHRGSLLLALSAAFVVVFPVLLSPSERVLGERFVDGFGTQWWFWYVGELLAGRENVVHTSLFFFPTGKDVFAHTGGNLLDALFAWPLGRLFGQTAGYNLWIVVVVLSNFGAGSVLGRTVSGERGWPAGVALALNPFVLQELTGGRPTQAWLMFPALALAGVWGARSRTQAVGTGLAVAASGWVYWYSGLMVGVLALVVGSVRLVVGGDRLQHALRLGLAAAVATILVWPAVRWIQAEIAAGAVPGLLALDGTGVLAPLAMKTQEGAAAGLHVLALRGVAGSLFEDGTLQFTPGDPSLGYASVGAVFVALALALREKRLALVGMSGLVVTLSLVAATGPALVFGDHIVANPPWIWAAAHLDLLRRWWWPARAIFGVYLAIAMLVPLLSRSRLLAWGFVAASALELQRTGHLPMPTWDAHRPRPLLCLADAAPGAVVDLPFLSDQHNLWFQTLHHHPLLSGMLVKQPAFGSKSALDLRAANPFLSLLLDYGEVRVTRDPTVDEDGRADLLARGFAYVVVDEGRFEGAAVGRLPGKASMWPRIRRLLAPALGEPAIEGEGVAVYRLDRGPIPCDR